MISRLSIGVGTDHAYEMRNFDCLRPSGSFVVGWIDFDPDSNPRGFDARKYAIVLLRSGRILASRGGDIRAVPECLFSYIRKNCAS
jgi:hypothetical protein